MYKKALSSFFLKVHPDFFHFNHTYQRTNENAVAQLNELLGWAKEFKKGAFRPPPSTKIAFTFYRRLDEKESPQGNTAGTSTSGAMSGDAVTTLQSTFELPPNFKPQEANRGMVERSVNKFLRDLLRRAECIDTVTESLSEAEDRTAERLEERPLRRRPRPVTLQDKQREQKMKHRGGSQGEDGQHRTLMDEAVDSLTSPSGAFWSASGLLPRPPSLEELMEADQVFLSTTLSPLQCAAALHTLRTHLPEMLYHQWDAMPLVIGQAFGIGVGIGAGAAADNGERAASANRCAETPVAASSSIPSEGEEGVSGSITIPWDFTLPQFLAFLKQNETAIRLAKVQVEQRATDIEALIGQLCHALRWDDVLLSCSHVEAHRVLLLLSRNIALLDAHGVTDITVELGSRYATRSNGVLILNVHHLAGSGGNHQQQHQGNQPPSQSPLQQWLTAVTPKLALQKELYRVSKHLLETTMWYVKEVERVLELSPGQVDVFDHNECTYAERLQWIKELFRVSAGLSQWDWSEFRFILGPSSASSSRQLQRRRRLAAETALAGNVGVQQQQEKRKVVNASEGDKETNRTTTSNNKTDNNDPAHPTTAEASSAAGQEEEDEVEVTADEDEGDVLDLNWERKVMMLPYNMDGDAFLRYVEMIQQETKEKRRAALMAEHEAQRLETERAREAAHQQEMMLSGEEAAELDYQDHGREGRQARREGISMGAPVVHPTAADILYSREAPLMEQPGSRPGDVADEEEARWGGGGRSSSSRGSGGRGAPAYMDEYMTSSRIGGPDPLSVERPLHHAVHFNSDTEAEDNLKWEGFYQQPFVDQVPTGDLDDVSHAFHLTNRSHREAAAKKLLEELQGTYGKKSRRFDYQKMGDVLEINNARVQPKGFPVLARGVRPGGD